MYDVSGRQFVAFSQLCLSDLKAAEFSAFIQQLWSGSTVDSSIDSASAEKRSIRRIHYCIDLQLCYIINITLIFKMGFWAVNANNLSVIGIYPAKKSNRIFWTKHFALMRKFRARGRPSLNDRHRLFQG